MEPSFLIISLDILCNWYSWKHTLGTTDRKELIHFFFLKIHQLTIV